MNVVLFVGNGFDLALGLSTSYKDFLSEWLKEETSKEDCIKQRCVLYDLKRVLLWRRIIGCENWSDLELAIGEVDYESFDSIAGGEGLLLHGVTNSVSLLESSLANYLKKTQDLFAVPAEKLPVVREMFLTSIVRTVFSVLTGVDAQVVNLDFVTLNYTDSIEKMIKGGRVFFVDALCHNVEVRVGERVLHPHGKLGGGHLVFGLDNMDQFKGAVIKGGQLEQYRAQLCKSERTSTNEVAETMECLRSADVILTFGISWGATDRTWWRRLQSALRGPNGPIVCACPYEREFENVLKCGLENELESKFRTTVERSLSSGTNDVDEVCMSRIKIPRLEQDEICCVERKVGDYLGLNAINKILGQEKEDEEKRRAREKILATMSPAQRLIYDAILGLTSRLDDLEGQIASVENDVEDLKVSEL